MAWTDPRLSGGSGGSSGGGWKDPRLGGGGGSSSKAPTKAQLAFLKKHKGSSIFGRVGQEIQHIPGNFLHGGKQWALSSPAGIYALAAGGVNDVEKALLGITGVHGKGGGWQHPAERAARKKTAGDWKTPKNAEAMLKSTLVTARHPLRDTFATFTLLSAALNPALGAGMRTSAGLRAAAAAGKTGQLELGAEALAGTSKIRAFAIGAKAKPVYVRMINHPRGKLAPTQMQAFRSPIGIASQKLMDKARYAFPNSRIFSPMHGSLHAKIMHERNINRRMQLAVAEGPAAELMLEGKKLSKAEQVALYVVNVGENKGGVGQNAFIRDHIAFHEQMIKEGVGSKRGHNRWIKALQEADQYVYNTKHGPKIKKDQHELLSINRKMQAVEEHRTALLENLGLVGPGEAAGRASATAEHILFGERLAPEEGGQIPIFDEELNPHIAPERFGPQGRRMAEIGAFGPRINVRDLGFKPRPSQKQFVPESLTHEYNAELLRTGKMGMAFTRYMAESSTEAERFASLLRARSDLSALSKPAAETSYDIPFNIGALSEVNPKFAGIFEKLNAGEKLTGEETQMLGVAYEFYRESVFPSKNSVLPAGIKWIDKRELADLHKPTPWLGSYTKLGAGVDVVNDASRLMLIYLKLGYLPANFLGNVAMNVIQQGFAAPWNLARAWKTTTSIHPGTLARMDRTMGLGITSLARSSTNIVHGVTTAYSEVAAKLIDRVPRRASFIHEAAKMGYKSDADLTRLLEGDPSVINDLTQITRNAREAIGDYERLGPFEKGVIRRLIFFYPWLKVSSRMTGRTIMEYPYKTAAITQFGALGAEYQRDRFGIPGMPAGMEGSIPVGKKSVFDPRSIGIWSTPVEIASAVAALSQGNAPPAYDLLNFNTPLVASLVYALAHKNPSSGRPSNKSTLKLFREGMIGGVPIITLYTKLTEGDKKRKGYLDSNGSYVRRQYQQSFWDALWQFSTSGWRGPIDQPTLAKKYKEFPSP